MWRLVLRVQGTNRWAIENSKARISSLPFSLRRSNSIVYAIKNTHACLRIPITSCQPHCFSGARKQALTAGGWRECKRTSISVRHRCTHKHIDIRPTRTMPTCHMLAEHNAKNGYLQSFDKWTVKQCQVMENFFTCSHFFRCATLMTMCVCCYRKSAPSGMNALGSFMIVKLDSVASSKEALRKCFRCVRHDVKQVHTIYIWGFYLLSWYIIFPLCLSSKIKCTKMSLSTSYGHDLRDACRLFFICFSDLYIVQCQHAVCMLVCSLVCNRKFWV